MLQLCEAFKKRGKIQPWEIPDNTKLLFLTTIVFSPMPIESNVKFGLTEFEYIDISSDLLCDSINSYFFEGEVSFDEMLECYRLLDEGYNNNQEYEQYYIGLYADEHGSSHLFLMGNKKDSETVIISNIKIC